MARYKIQGGVPVIGTLTQSVDSDFPIVIANDIELSDGTNLETLVTSLNEAVFGGGGDVPLSEIDDTIRSTETTWSSDKIARVISDLKQEIPTFDSVYSKDEVYSKTETSTLISNTLSSELSNYATQQQLSASIDNGIANAVEAAKRYTDNKDAELATRIESLEDKVGAGFVPITEEEILAYFQDEP